MRFRPSSKIYLLFNIFLIDYRHQDDETVASRGSISMKKAALREVERTRFQVHSIPSRLHHQHSPTQKWFMKANHPVEARRWTQAIEKSIEWYKMREGTDSDASSIIGGGNVRIKSSRRKSTESESSTMMRTTPSTHSQSVSGFWRKSPPINGNTIRDQDSITGNLDMTDASPDLSRNDAAPPDDDPGVGDNDQEEEEEEDTSSAAHSDNKTSPHPNIDLQANAAAAQLELTIQMVANLSTSSTATPPSSSQFRETLPVLLDSLQTTQSLLSEYTSMAQSRDSWYTKQLRKERARQDVWEESLKVLVKEGEGLESELRKRSRNRGSRVFAAGSPAGTIIGGIGEGKRTKRPSTLGLVTTAPGEEPLSSVSDGEPPLSTITPRVPSSPPMTPQQRQRKEHPLPPVPVITAASRIPSRHVSIVAPINGDQGENDDHDTDEEDEFFDAIENNALPNMLVYEALSSPSFVTSPTSSRDNPEINGASTRDNNKLVRTTTTTTTMKVVDDDKGGCYAGYMNMRSSLNLSKDRPNASLWSVLKHSIGKDLTKISFPVFFNEPTSMLQRMVRFFSLLRLRLLMPFALIVGRYGVFRVLYVFYFILFSDVLCIFILSGCGS